jgi:hypothetical protein
MNSFDQSWSRLTAAARQAAEGEVVPAPAAAWLTRVGALAAAEQRQQSRAGAAWLSWCMPGFGIASLVAILALSAWGSTVAQPEATTDLVALADPLEGNSLLP